MLPSQSIVAGTRTPLSTSLRYAQAVPNTPNGTEMRNTRRQSIGCQHPAEHEADKRPGDGGHAVDPQSQPPLILREGVGQDGARVGELERAADGLADSHEDDPEGSGRAGHPVDGQEDREDGEDREPEVVHPDPPVHVPEPPEGEHQHRRDQQEPHQDPEEVGAVAGGQRD